MVRDLELKFKYPIAGSLRIGEKNEKNIPKKLDYFTVHEDTHTLNEVVKQFNEKYDKPKELIIKFLSDDPLEVSYLRYGKSGLLCKGDGEKASQKNDSEWIECECSKNCESRGKDCKLTGRLHFLIKGINIGGLWRLQTQSYNTIQNFISILNFLKSMNIDIKQKDFKLITEENKSIVDGKVKKYTTVNLKLIDNDFQNSTENINKIESENNLKLLEKDENKEDENLEEVKEQDVEVITSDTDYKKCLTLVEVRDVTIGNTIVKKALFCNMKDETIELLLHPDIAEDICNWEISSTIIPINIYTKNENKILKEFKEIAIIKKAV